MIASALALVIASMPQAAAQASDRPETVVVQSSPLSLHALLWRPHGSRPFPAVLFNHGTYSADDPLSVEEADTLGSLFARHGYVFLFLCRRGVGLSADQGLADGDLMARAMAADGQTGRNRVQLQLLEGEALREAVAGLAFLRRRPDVDASRISVAGHSFGGSLTLFLAAKDLGVRSAVVFGAAAGSWGKSPELRTRLLAAVGRISAPVLFIHAANDYSTAPGQALAAEMERRGTIHRLIVYPAFGRTAREGHNLVFRSVTTWERDVFAFLEDGSQKGSRVDLRRRNGSRG